MKRHKERAGDRASVWGRIEINPQLRVLMLGDLEVKGGQTIVHAARG